MDDTDKILERFQRRMANANRLYDQAEARRAAADAIERKLELPIAERPIEDETLLRLEARLLREQADKLSRSADGIQERLYEPPSADLKRAAKKWANAHSSPETDRQREIQKAFEHRASRDRGGWER